jgi:4-hydroxy-tetrahydrodipicolinate reductase
MGTEIRQLLDSDPAQWNLMGGTAKGILADAQTQEVWPDLQKLPNYLRKTELIIDFSAPEANQELFRVISNAPDVKDIYFLLGTTGLSQDQLKAWQVLAKQRNWRLLIAPNTSLGVLLTLKVSQLLGQVVSPLGFDIELIESHHRNKIDAPSGTAKFLAEGVARTTGKTTIYGRVGRRLESELGIASLRGGSVFGEHELRFLGDHEEITVSHRALSRTLFAQGAIHLSRWLLRQATGCYQLEDITIEEMVALLNTKSGA